MCRMAINSNCHPEFQDCHAERRNCHPELAKDPLGNAQNIGILAPPLKPLATRGRLLPQNDLNTVFGNSSIKSSVKFDSVVQLNIKRLL